MDRGAVEIMPGIWLYNAAFRDLEPVFYERGTEESNLALRFWRPPCYRYTSPPPSTDSKPRRRGDRSCV